MSVLKNENFAFSLLAGSITDIETSITVTSGDGSLFPSSGYFMAAIWDGSTASPGLDSDRELVKATFVSGDIFTIDRAQEGTSAKAWSSSDNFACVLTAGKIDELETYMQNQMLSYGVASGTNTYTVTLDPAITSYETGIIIRTKYANASTGAVTLNVNGLGGKKVYAIDSSSYVALGSGNIIADMYGEMIYDASLDSGAGGWVFNDLDITSTDLINDTSPQLGGDLDLNGYDITGGGIIPSGGIIMWSGAISAIPTGWVLCDGSSGTPDLTDRFVIHADADSGGTNDVGDTGGSNTIAEAQLPSHTHSDGTLSAESDSHNHGVGTLATDDPGDHTHTYSSRDGGGYGYPEGTAGAGTYRNTSSSGAHTHTISGSSASTGSGNDYKPKYYALAYIMKS